MSPATKYDIESCSYGYDQKMVLHDITLSLESGNLYGLIGPNGSGKSTLLSLLSGAHRPQTGSCRLNGEEHYKKRKKELAKQITVVTQQQSLNYDFTVEEVVMMGRYPFLPRFAPPSERDIQLVEENMDTLDIKRLRKRQVTKLSGGEQQRVAAARCLTQGCPVVLLDEVTANLDIRHSIDIMSIMRDKAKQDNSLIVAAIHDLNIAAGFCHKIIALNHGRLAAHGNTEKVLSRQLISDLFQVAAEVDKKPNGQLQVHYQI